METAFDLMSKRILDAYKEANNAIYFNDSSRYGAALYQVCTTLCPSVDVRNIGIKYIE